MEAGPPSEERIRDSPQRLLGHEATDLAAVAVVDDAVRANGDLRSVAGGYDQRDGSNEDKQEDDRPAVVGDDVSAGTDPQEVGQEQEAKDFLGNCSRGQAGSERR